MKEVFGLDRRLARDRDITLIELNKPRGNQLKETIQTSE